MSSQGSQGSRGSSDLQTRAARVKLLLLDVDGVLTDGRVILNGGSSESKNFHIRDGISMVWAQRVGLKVGLLSARSSPTTTQRAAQLGITLMYQGVQSKIESYDHIVGEVSVADDEVAYMGDDIVDLAVLERVGLATAPADAVDEVRSRVHWVSSRPGGNGAVRELIEMILRAQGHWDDIVASYRAAAPVRGA